MHSSYSPDGATASLRATPPHTTLPEDIINTILGFLPVHQPTLSSCSRVSRLWLGITRRYLFESISVVSRTSGSGCRFLQFLKFLKENPDVCEHIKELTLTASERCYYRIQRASICSHVLADILSSLPNLRALRLSKLQFTHIPLGSWMALCRRLAAFGRGAIKPWAGCEHYHPQIEDLNRGPFKLQKLVLDTVGTDSNGSFIDILCLFSRLTSLEINALRTDGMGAEALNMVIIHKELSAKALQLQVDSISYLSSANPLAMRVLRHLLSTPLNEKGTARRLRTDCNSWREVNELGSLLHQVGTRISHLHLTPVGDSRMLDQCTGPMRLDPRKRLLRHISLARCCPNLQELTLGVASRNTHANLEGAVLSLTLLSSLPSSLRHITLDVNAPRTLKEASVMLQAVDWTKLDLDLNKKGRETLEDVQLQFWFDVSASLDESERFCVRHHLSEISFVPLLPRSHERGLFRVNQISN